MDEGEKVTYLWPSPSFARRPTASASACGLVLAFRRVRWLAMASASWCGREQCIAVHVIFQGGEFHDRHFRMRACGPGGAVQAGGLGSRMYKGRPRRTCLCGPVTNTEDELSTRHLSG